MNEEIVKLLKEQTKYLRFMAIPKIIEAIEQNIVTDEQKGVFKLTNGIKSTRDISNELLKKNIKISHVTVANYWKKWSTLGIVIPSDTQYGRFQAILDISELNL